MSDMYVVKVVKFGTLEEVRTFDADSLRKAEKLRDGLEINISHDYFVTISKKE